MTPPGFLMVSISLDILILSIRFAYEPSFCVCSELAKFALQVEAQSPQIEMLYPNPIVTPAWEQSSREGLAYALRRECVRLDSAALIDRMKNFYGDEVAAGVGVESLRSKLKLLEADTARFSNIHFFDEVNCRLELGVQQWSSARQEPLPNADFMQKLERSALFCQLHEELGPKIVTEADLQAAVQLCGGYSVSLVRRFLMRAANAFQNRNVGNPSPMHVAGDQVESKSDSSSAVQWWGASNTPRLALIAAHDTTILPLLLAFGMFDFRWPVFGSSICVELYRSEDSGSAADQFYVRILYLWPRRSTADPDSTVINQISDRSIPLHDFLSRIQFYSTDHS